MKKEEAMTYIMTVSARGQIVIPAKVREAMKIKEGERLVIVLEEDQITIKRLGGKL